MFMKDKAPDFIALAGAQFLRLEKAVALLKGEENSLLSRESRRFEEQHPGFVPQYSLPRRGMALAMTVILSAMFIYPRDPMIAQTFQKYEAKSKKDVEQFMDRADRMSDRDAWTNYVELGIATERVQWEDEAADEMAKRRREVDADSSLVDADKKLKKDEAAALYEAARVQWEIDALENMYEERGAFTARKEAVDTVQITEAEYNKITAAADAAVADIAAMDLAAYDSAVGQGRDPLVAQFDLALSTKLTDARTRNTGLSPAEKAAFEAELSKREGDIRNEFSVRDSFYIKRARNRYIAVKRADDVSARLAADKASADAVGDAAIEDTLEDLQKSTDNALDTAQQAIQDTLSGPNASTVEDTWQKRMEALIEAGLHRWEVAEEDLYSKRLVWMQESRSTREEAEGIWKENHDKLKAARDKWLKEVQQQIVDGRQRWDQKALEFQQSREVAERELDNFVNQERQKWEASSKELSDMVKGGGSALLEAKDAYRYYADILATKGEPSASQCTAPATDDLKLRCFYKEQRDYMGAAISRFQGIMTSSAGILKDVMHSPDDTTGLLNDKRIFIDPALVTEITGIGTGNYKTDMVALVTGNKAEDFLLYQRDLLNLSDRNALFVTRAGELKASTDFKYSSAATLDDLRSMVLKMDIKYSDHKRELLAIIEKDRSGLDDTHKLAAIKQEMDDWFSANTQENARLKREVAKYFTDGLGGYYLTGSDTDPYLMTQAEYEWELLRRERNYLAARLRKAEEVKRYADLASRHDAGLELAAVTEERQAVAKIRADLREVSYRLIKGDIPINPQALTDTGIRDAEYLRILAERGIDPAAVTGREARLNDEISILTTAAGLSNPSKSSVTSLITSIDDYFTRTGTARQGSALAPLYDKLISYRDALDRGEDPAVLSDRWKVISGAASDVKGEMQTLLQEYNFNGLRSEFTALNVQVGQKTIVNYNDELRLISAQMDVTSKDLAAAQERLERAKVAYREARIDFDVIRLGNSEDLVRIDLLNTTQSLASVLNRMSVIENIPGFSGLTDQAGLKQLEYFNTAGENERAKDAVQRSADILKAVLGLEESKKRRAALEALPLGGLGSKTAEQVVDFFTGAAGIVNTTATDETLRSHGAVTRSLDALTQLKTDLVKKRTDLTAKQADLAKAQTDAKPASEIAALALDVELLRKDVSVLEGAVFRTAEALTAAIRGEEQARRSTVLYMLGQKDGSGNLVTADSLNKTYSDQEKAVETTAYDAAKDAASGLYDFLSSNKKKSFADLLKLINDQEAALADHASAVPDPARDRQRAVLNTIRSYVLNFKSMIDYSNKDPDQYDGRSQDTKWESLIVQVDTLKKNALFYSQFQNGIPTSASDSWVTNFKQERSAVLSKLSNVLTATDAQLKARFDSLPAADREIIARYGSLQDSNLRAGLNAAVLSLRTDIDGAAFNFRQLYLREQAISAAGTIALINPDLQAKQSDYNATTDEFDRLTRDKAALITQRDAEPNAAAKQALQDRIDDITARLGTLDTRRTDLLASLTTLQDQYRNASAVMAEAQKAGSSATLVGTVMAELKPDTVRVEMLRYTLNMIAQPEAKAEEALKYTHVEQIKGILGFFETEPDGTIRRDSNGKGVISAEFRALTTDPDADLQALLSSNQKGADLERWAQRLQDFLRDPDKAKLVPAEIRAAVELLQTSMLDYRAAVLFIEHRDNTLPELQALASDMTSGGRTKTEKLTLVISLENDIRAAIERAQAQNADTVEAALAVLEKAENARVLSLFAGYDASGKADTVTDPETDKRLMELATLAERLRNARLDRKLSDMALRYAQSRSTNTALLAANPGVIDFTRDDFIQGYPELKAEQALAAVGALADATFRADLWRWVESTASNPYRDEVITVLTLSRTEGAALKTEVTAALAALRNSIDSRMSTLLGGVEAPYMRDRDVVVKDSIEALMTAYAVKAATSRTKMLPVIAAVADGTAVDTAKATLSGKVNDLLSDAALTSVRRDLLAMIDKGTDTAAIKTVLTAYLNGLTDPSAADVAKLKDDLYERETLKALALSESTDTYKASDYPSELREVILLRAYDRAQKRYQDFLMRRSADTQSIRDSAALDLSGLMGDMARAILVQDFDSYVSANSVAAFITAGEGRRTVSDYVNAYLTDRKTDVSHLPGMQAVLERLALGQFQTITADAAAAGSALWKLDERTYLADFRSYLLLAKLDNFKQSTGLVLTGTTPEDRLTNLRTSLDTMLDSADYSIGGKSLRQRLLSSQDIEAFVRAAFAYLEAGGGPANPGVKNTYLPSALADRIRDNKLADAAFTADSYLPSDLKAIVNYQNKNYRDTAAASNAKLLSVLAKVDTLTSEPAAVLTDAEITSLINRSGYGSVSASVQSELLELMRARNVAMKAGSASSAAAALQAYRQHRVFETLFASQSVQDDVKVFITSGRTTIDSVESKFFTELANSHADLRRLAKEQRGAFFEALIGQVSATGAGSAYYASLSTLGIPGFDGKAEFDKLVAKLTSSFSTEEKTHMKDNAGLYRQTFDLRSGQELVTSGIFEGTESSLMTGLLRSRTGGVAPKALLDAVRANPNAAMRAFIKELYKSAGIEPADAASDAFISSVPGLSARMAELVSGIDPALKKTLLTERVLVNRFLDLFSESDTDRAFVDRVLTDPTLTQPGADLAINLEASKTALIAQKNMSELTGALLGTLKEHQVYAANARDRFAMDQELGRRLNEFAALRGSDIKTSRWGSYRSYVGIERGYQDADYQRYAADHPDPDPTIEQTNGGLLLTGASQGQDDAKSLLNGNWHDALTSDNRTPVQTVVLDNGTVDPSDDKTIEMTSVKTASDAKTRKDRFTVNGVLDRDAMMTSIYYESLANNYLEMLSRLNASISGALSAATLADAHKNDATDFLATVRTSYNANDTAAVTTDALVKVKQDEEAKLAKYSDSEVQAKQAGVAQTRNEFDNAARDFAGAGRRNALLSMNEFQYKQQILDPAVAEFQAADQAVLALSTIAEQQRLDHAAKSREVTDAMNTMADFYRSFTVANQDYDMRRAVYDYANTPYLSAGTNDPNAGTADAENKYQQALAAYEASQQSLSDAGLRVQTQDRLEVFNAVVAGLEGTPPKSYPVLSSDERTSMYDLQARKLRPPTPLSSSEALELTTLQAKDPAALTANEKTRLESLEARKKASQPLTADEENLLASFVERDVAERYKDVLRTRADEIKQTMRMVRIHKANEIIQAEIEKRRVTAEEKKRQFESALDYNLPVTIPACKAGQSAADCKAMQDEVKASQLTIYQRLVQAQETGGNLGMFNEYKSWYWASGQFGQTVFQSWTNSATLSWLPPLPSFTPQQVNEAAGGIAMAGAMNAEDRTAMLTYLANGGQVQEFNRFAPQYYAFMQTLAQADAMQAMVPIAMQTAFIMAQAGGVMIALGSLILPTAAPFYTAGAAFLSTGATMLAAAFFTFGASIGPALSMIASGLAAIAFGVGITAAAIALIAGGVAAITGGVQLVQNAVLQAQVMQQFAVLTGLNTIGNSTAQSAMKVRDTEKEYQAAQADLDYFTKVKDMETLKEHLVEYGKQHGDDMDQDGKYDALYSLTDEDLQYLTDAGGFIDSSGNAQAVSADVQTDALSVTGEYKASDFIDSFGRFYNPDTLTASPPALTLVSGAYREADGTKWTQVLVANANGSRTTKYAKLVNGDGKVTSDSQKHSAYDMGRILQMLVDHGDRIMADRLQKYITAGDSVTASGGDEGFVLRERDQTFQYLHDKAGADEDGGYEYSGYAMTNSDYTDNASAVYFKELDQSVAVQKKEWDLRQLELDTSRAEWEEKMQTILSRGQKAWASSEDKYLAQWRKWEKEYDRDVEDGVKEWDKKIAQHFTDRDAWEAKIRSSTTSANINDVMGSSIDSLNTQLEAASANLKVPFEKVNRLKAVQDMIAEVRAKDPSGVDRLALVNKNIDKFSTLLGIGEIQASNHFSGLSKGGSSSLLSDFKKAMDDHKKGMKVYANAKAMEAYQKMIAQLEEQIDRQNQAVVQQTEVSAATQGYTKVGGVFVKNAGTGGMTGVVNAYTMFSGKEALQREMGPSLKSTGEIIDMLKNQSEVEVEAFFYTHRLVTQAAFEKIMGRGTSDQRKTARDERTLGQFGMWVGREPNSETVSQVNQAAGGSFSSVQGTGRTVATNAVSGGFGELGSSGARPGGAPIGFYLQLQLMGDALSQHDAKHMLDLNGDFTNTFAGGSIGYQLGMAYNNARVRTEIYHESKGKVYNAEAAKFTKAAAKSAAVIAASTIGGWGGFAAGAALMAAGEGLNENGTFSMNSQKATSLGIGIGAVGVGAYMGAGGTGISDGANMGVNFTTGVVQSGFHWDAQGHQEGGFGYKGGAFESALLTGAVSAGMGAATKAGELGITESAFASQAVTGTLNSAIQFQKYKAGEHNNFEQMMKSGDIGIIGGLVGSIAGGYASQSYKADRAAKEAENIQRDGDWPKMTAKERAAATAELAQNPRYADVARILAQNDVANQANQEGQKQAALTIMRGAGYRREDGGAADGAVSTDKAATFVIAAMQDRGIKFTAEDWNALMNQAGGLDQNGQYGTTNIDTVKALLATKGIDFNTLNFDNVARNMGQQEQYSRMMDQVRAQQAYSSSGGSSTWDDAPRDLYDKHMGALVGMDPKDVRRILDGDVFTLDRLKLELKGGVGIAAGLFTKAGREHVGGLYSSMLATVGVDVDPETIMALPDFIAPGEQVAESIDAFGQGKYGKSVGYAAFAGLMVYGGKIKGVGKFLGKILGAPGRYVLEKLAERRMARELAKLSDDAFVRWDPVTVKDTAGNLINVSESISRSGIKTEWFGGKIWLTKYGDVKHIADKVQLQEVLYRQNMWAKKAVDEYFQSGAVLRTVKNVENAVPAGITNVINGVRQWRIMQNIRPENVSIIKILQ